MGTPLHDWGPLSEDPLPKKGSYPGPSTPAAQDPDSSLSEFGTKYAALFVKFFSVLLRPPENPALQAPSRRTRCRKRGPTPAPPPRPPRTQPVVHSRVPSPTSASPPHVKHGGPVAKKGGHRALPAAAQQDPSRPTVQSSSRLEIQASRPVVICNDRGGVEGRGYQLSRLAAGAVPIRERRVVHPNSKRTAARAVVRNACLKAHDRIPVALKN
jgi:hypothetical protein